MRVTERHMHYGASACNIASKLIRGGTNVQKPQRKHPDYESSRREFNALQGAIWSITIFVLLVLAFGCGSDYKDRRGTNSPPSELQVLKNKVFNLEASISTITNFVAGDFRDCSSGLPPFETKICQIAQTASAEQLIKIQGELAVIITEHQERLYGAGCETAEAAGCPIAGSIMAELGSTTGDIATLQADVAALQADYTALDTRVSDIEALVSGTDYYSWIFLCEDISLWRHEPLLITGDRSIIRFYTAGANNGMGQLSLGDGDLYTQTNVNPKCQVKFYDLGTEYKVCWNNTDKNASEASIDTECGNGTGPYTADCTCK